MEVIEPGHIYRLNNHKTSRQTTFQFFKDPEIHNGKFLDGPNSQEVIRVLIDRVQHLDLEQPWEGNQEILKHLRSAIAWFEARAMLRKIEKDELNIEEVDVGHDGHIKLSGVSTKSL